MNQPSTLACPDVMGIDLGDRLSEVCVLRDGVPDPVERRKVRTTPDDLRQLLEARRPCRVVIEAGTHSPWVDRVIRATGHESIVANPRQVALISGSDRKTDRTDAETLARLARVDVALLRPIRHRGETTQRHMEALRARDAMVRARTLLINHVRGAVKSWGMRLSSRSADAFARMAWDALPTELGEMLEPCLETIQRLTDRINLYERRIADLCQGPYPATRLLRQVKGVGPVTSLAYVLTIEDPHRIQRNRLVGAYLGLVPRSDQSGSTNRQLGIAKSGDKMLRRLLVQSAHYILGPFGPDTALKRYGLKLAARGGANARKRAAVAVARRLAVLLLRLWKTGETYQPFPGTTTPEEPTARTS